MAAFDQDLLIPPFNKLGQLSGSSHIPYYTGIFDEYEYYLIKDEVVNLDWLKQANLSEPMLEVGSGEGRILSELAQMNLACFGIETSKEAIRRFKQKQHLAEREIIVYEGDFFDFKFDRKFGSVIIPNLTIHLFNDVPTLEQLAKKLSSILLPSGKFAVSIFCPESIQKMSVNYKGQTFVVPFNDDLGKERIMWTGLKFEDQHRTMIQNWYTQVSPSEGFLSADKQRFWLEEELQVIFKPFGLELTHKYDGAITGGGADGFVTNHLIFTLSNN
ncbi:methyltransferase domain-containing protein [Mucilaginibacter sp. CAU 1740]|uniref:methyltransferase domain-containing protein n=1 Tax=Mucilaginibacter sp. CAU 1740 TaxID=3140365 RepID=UPI00325C26F7